MKQVITAFCEKCNKEFNNPDLCLDHEAVCKGLEPESLLGNWKKFIKHISSKRLHELIFGKGGSYERCTYWNRSYNPKEVNADGSVTYSSKDSSADSHADIFTLGIRFDHIIYMYNHKDTSDVERLFLQNYMFVYLMENIDYRHNRFHDNFLYYMQMFYDPKSNGTNCHGRINEEAFKLYYILQRMGVDYERIVNSTRKYLKNSSYYQGLVKHIKNCIQGSDERNMQSIKNFWNLPIFEDSIHDLDDLTDDITYWFFDHLDGAEIYPGYCGIKEIDKYVKVIGWNTIKYVGHNVKIKIVSGERLLDKIWIDYNSHDIRKPNYSYLVDLNTKMEDVNEGDVVIRAAKEENLYRIWSPSYNFNQQEHQKYVDWQDDQKKRFPGIDRNEEFILKVVKTSK
jgi:hypothetical protein